jgi:hypothetical protein
MTTLSRRKFLGASGAVLAAPAIARPAFAQAQVTLKLHHFLPPVSNGHSKMLAPWAKMVEEDSGGKIKIDIFPSMQLGGTPPQLYDQARDGVVDIVWTLPGSTAGPFPLHRGVRAAVRGRASRHRQCACLAGVTRTPTSPRKRATSSCSSFWSHDHGPDPCQQEVEDRWTTSGAQAAARRTRLAGEALKALGATAVPMPIPQVPRAWRSAQSIGCVCPGRWCRPSSCTSSVKYHTEIPGSPRSTTASFFLP